MKDKNGIELKDGDRATYGAEKYSMHFCQKEGRTWIIETERGIFTRTIDLSDEKEVRHYSKNLELIKDSPHELIK